MRAQKLPETFFKTAPVERKTLVEEITHEYYVRKYSPPVKVVFVEKQEECSYSSPEEIVIAHLSAMAAVDYEWDVSCWNEESQKINAAQYRSANITPDHLKEKWKEVFKGSQFELVTRVDFRGGVVIEYKVIRQSNAKPKTFTFQNVAKKQADGKWKLTQELASNPVKNNWHIPEEKVKRTIRY
ncbi:MAG: hypothetical protein O7B35_03525 [Deltaproteobacteria bacterium]|nr:hypothetical protein [Deltaproteobacteria bacterium]